MTIFSWKEEEEEEEEAFGLQFRKDPFRESMLFSCAKKLTVEEKRPWRSAFCGLKGNSVVKFRVLAVEAAILDCYCKSFKLNYSNLSSS